MSQPRASLRVTRVTIPVRLGWDVEERGRPQPVEIEVEVRFGEPPAACASDRLDQTVDYGALVERLHARATAGEYRLLEHLGTALYQAARVDLPAGVRVALTVAKRPPLDLVLGSASFRLADWD